MLQGSPELDIKSGVVDSDDLLIRKGNQLHVIMLQMIAIYGVVYSIVNYLQGKYVELVFILPVVPGVAIAYLLYAKGHTKSSKIWNLFQVVVSISGCCLVTTPATFIVAFFVPIMIGILIVFQGQERKLGYFLAAISFIDLVFLLTTDIRIGNFPLLSKQELRIEWMMNTIGAAILSTLQVTFILSLNNSVQRRLIKKSIELNDSNVQLQTAITTRDTMMSVLSHDLRSPLILLNSSMELMRPSKMASEDQEKLMFQLRNRTQQTLSLVDNLLLWSRNQSESVKYIPSALPISGVVKFISDYTQLLQSEKQVSVTINSPSDGNVFADKDLLDCILRNIISNAYKFTPRGGAVNISISKSSNQWNFSIKDSGQGITPAALQKLSSGISFTTIGTANEKGHGLGLQLVKDFLQLHNSRLKISSEIGVGSEFSFTLPAAD